MRKLFDLATTPAVWIALAVIVVCVLSLSYCHQRDNARKGEGEARVATSQADLGQSASERADAVRGAEKANADLTQRNTDSIQSAENANDDAGEAGMRGRLAWCERERLRGNPVSPQCAQLRRADPQ